jgi:hypothetical protein
MMVYADLKDNDKRKVVQEPKHNSRLQQKYAIGTSSIKGTTSSRPILGIASLLDNFSFINFSDAEVILLFKNIEFSLGTQDDIKINVVNKFRTLLKLRFMKIVKDIQKKKCYCSR